MGQSEEYLAAHKIIVQKDEQIAQLQAQVAELQGDVSRLTIENEQLKEVVNGQVVGVDDNRALTLPPLALDPVVEEHIDAKPTKKSRTTK